MFLLKIRIANHQHCHNPEYHCMSTCWYETAALSTKFFSRTWTKFRIESPKRPSKLRSFIYSICLRIVTNPWMIRWLAETLSFDDVKGKAIPFEAWRCAWGSRGLRLPEILCSWHVKVVSPTHQPPPPPTPLEVFEVLISVRGRIPMTPSGIEPTQCLNQLRHGVPHDIPHLT